MLAEGIVSTGAVPWSASTGNTPNSTGSIFRRDIVYLPPPTIASTAQHLLPPPPQNLSPLRNYQQLSVRLPSINQLLSLVLSKLEQKHCHPGKTTKGTHSLMSVYYFYKRWKEKIPTAFFEGRRLKAIFYMASTEFFIEDRDKNWKLEASVAGRNFILRKKLIRG